MGTLRCWHEQSGPAAAEGVAGAVIRVTAQILTEPLQDIADILEQQMAVALCQELDAHPHRGCLRCAPPPGSTVH
ncbi:hypothetical protein [Streptomyces sp. NPDC054849]